MSVSVLKIGYRDIEIVATPMENCGEYLPQSGKILISTGMLPDVEQNTVLHEVIHAVMDQYCPQLIDADEEAVAHAVANGLCQVVRDNPHFFRLIGWARP